MTDSIITAALGFISGFLSDKLENSKFKPLIGAFILSFGMVFLMAILLFIKFYIIADLKFVLFFFDKIKYYILIFTLGLFILSYIGFLIQFKKKNKSFK